MSNFYAPTYPIPLNVSKLPSAWVHGPCITLYTECPRRNVPYFRRVILMLKYTDITQNTYVRI